MTRHHFIGALVLLTGAICLPANKILAADNDVKPLLKGVLEIAAPGIPGPLCVFGDTAFAVVAADTSNSSQAPVVAAARMGQGKVIAFGHTDYLNPHTLAKADTVRLMLNAIYWAGRKTTNNNDIQVGVYKDTNLRSYLQEQGLKAQEIGDDRLEDLLETVEVLCVYPAKLSNNSEIETIRAFIRRGGGLVAADLGWGWLQLNRGKTLQSDHPGNQLLVSAGIMWADGYLRKTGDNGYAVKQNLSPLLHVDGAINALKKHEKGTAKLDSQEVSQSVSTIIRIIRTLPGGPKVIGAELGETLKSNQANTIPTPKDPLSEKRHPLRRLILSTQMEESRRLPPEQVEAHPAAAEFPGSVPPNAEIVSCNVSIDTSILGWHSTGLYAPPGKLITVEVDQEIIDKGLHVRIGAHSDKLWNKDTWKRCPDICRRFQIANRTTRAANAFGGPIYIEVPRQIRLGTIDVTISGGIEAPLYVLGDTDVNLWRTEIKHRPAPWAELQTKKVILTVPSKVVRDIEDPEALMRFWDGVMDACADIAGWPRERKRPERYVADVQISAGYMHSGYPIMTHLDIAEVLVDRDKLMSNQHGGIWGLFHETGHNHQSRDWTFRGAGEVTVNLFTVYVLENVCGLTSEAHASFTKKARAEKLEKYLKSGAKFETWKKDPFLALDMYIRMQEAFGWEAFKKTFAEYRELAPAERPKDDDQRRDQWLVRFSRTVGRNLGPYFEAWGVPTSSSARDSISDLPVWMPTGFASKKLPPS
jgi:hypothetical protein